MSVLVVALIGKKKPFFHPAKKIYELYRSDIPKPKYRIPIVLGRNVTSRKSFIMKTTNEEMLYECKILENRMSFFSHFNNT